MVIVAYMSYCNSFNSLRLIRLEVYLSLKIIAIEMHLECPSPENFKLGVCVSQTAIGIGFPVLAALNHWLCICSRHQHNVFCWSLMTPSISNLHNYSVNGLYGSWYCTGYYSENGYNGHSDNLTKRQAWYAMI